MTEDDSEFAIPLPKSLWVPFRSVDGISLKYLYDAILPKDTFKSWDIRDDNMAPDIRRGDTVVAQVVDKNNWYNIGDYFVYHVVLDNEEMIARIYKENESTWLLKRDNIAGITTIHVNSIKDLYIVRLIIRRTEAVPRLFDITEKRSEQNPEQISNK
jgi:hypothetical protein